MKARDFCGIKQGRTTARGGGLESEWILARPHQKACYVAPRRATAFAEALLNRGVQMKKLDARIPSFWASSMGLLLVAALSVGCVPNAVEHTGVACKRDVDCDSSLTCIRGQCSRSVPAGHGDASVRPDASGDRDVNTSDAASDKRDAMAPDASDRDAGSDAMSPDAGPPSCGATSVDVTTSTGVGAHDRPTYWTRQPTQVSHAQYFLALTGDGRLNQFWKVDDAEWKAEDVTALMSVLPGFDYLFADAPAVVPSGVYTFVTGHNSKNEFIRVTGIQNDGWYEWRTESAPEEAARAAGRAADAYATTPGGGLAEWSFGVEWSDGRKGWRAFTFNLPGLQLEPGVNRWDVAEGELTTIRLGARTSESHLEIVSTAPGLYPSNERSEDVTTDTGQLISTLPVGANCGTEEIVLSVGGANDLILFRHPLGKEQQPWQAENLRSSTGISAAGEAAIASRTAVAQPALADSFVLARSVDGDLFAYWWPDAAKPPHVCRVNDRKDAPIASDPVAFNVPYVGAAAVDTKGHLRVFSGFDKAWKAAP